MKFDVSKLCVTDVLRKKSVKRNAGVIHYGCRILFSVVDKLINYRILDKGIKKSIEYIKVLA